MTFLPRSLEWVSRTRTIKKTNRRTGKFSGSFGDYCLRATEAFAAVKAFVARAIADGDVAAVRTRRGVLLVGDHRGERQGATTVAVAIFNLKHLGFLGNRQFRHRAVHLFFYLFQQAGHGQLRLGARDVQAFAVAGNELQSQPAENVIGDGRGVADLRVFGETARLKTLVRELAGERIQRHAVLKRHAGERADAVHQSADGRTFLRHCDEKFAGLAVLEQTDGEITFVAGDVEFVRERLARVGQTTAQRLAGFGTELDDFGFEFVQAGFQRGCVGNRRSGFVRTFVGLLGVQWLRTLRAVAINRHTFQAHLPRLNVSVADLGDGAFVRHVDGLGNRTADERLRGGHHFQMRQVTDAALALMRFERAIEDRQMVRFQAAANGRTIFLNVFNRVAFFDVRDDFGDGGRIITEAEQRIWHAAIDDFQHPAACEQFVFHQRDVGFNAGRVAIHQKRNRAGRREHGDLRVAVAVLTSFGERAVPAFARFGFEIIEFRARLNGFHGFAVQLDDAEHRLNVVLRHGFFNTGATGIAVTRKRAGGSGDFRALLVGMSGHDGGDGTGQRAAFVGIVRQAVAHAERTEVRKTEAERAKDVGVFRDVLRRITRIIHEDFLRGGVNAHGGFETLKVNFVTGPFEFHQFQRREIARGVFDKNLFAAWIRGMNRLGPLAGVPFLDRAVVVAGARPLGFECHTAA